MRSRIAVAFMLGLLVVPLAGAQFRRGGYFGRQAQYASRQDFDGPFSFAGVFRRAPYGAGTFVFSPIRDLSGTCHVI